MKFTTHLINRYAIALVVLLMTAFSCSDIEDCPTQMCLVAGGWKLVEVQYDNSKVDADLSKYRLQLNDPQGDATIASFVRTPTQGSDDTGNWSLDNVNPKGGFSGARLRLMPASADAELFDIESITPREMILIIKRDLTVKDGPATIRFILNRI